MSTLLEKLCGKYNSSNLTGGMAVMNTNHHLTKPVLIGEIQADGQFDIVWSTDGGVIGDPPGLIICQRAQG